MHTVFLKKKKRYAYGSFLPHVTLSLMGRDLVKISEASSL